MTALAAMAGLSQQMVSYVERGTRNPTLETLLRITQALGIPLGRMITKAEGKQQVGPALKAGPTRL